MDIQNLPERPGLEVRILETFGFSADGDAPAFSLRTDHVPDVDPTYQFDPETTLGILAGLKFNRRVLIQGYHGTGKSSHIEQVCARLNWPCIRINLDSHISRVDLIGRDAIVIEDGLQRTSFKEGLLPWALQHPVALVLDEYDAGRPDVMFVIQRILETEGRLTLLEQNRVIRPHPSFRLFATANTIGLGDSAGIYHGTQAINQGQLDRWNMVLALNYLAPEQEEKIILAKVSTLNTPEGRKTVGSMVAMAGLTRNAFVNGDLSVVMSPRTVIHWAENYTIMGNLEKSFAVTFMNRVDASEKSIIAECYQRCFGVEISANSV